MKEFTCPYISINGAGSFQSAMNGLSSKTNRALFALNGRHKLSKLPINKAFEHFDSMIFPILFYGSEVWEAYEYDKLH